jgi:hypothetical protein
MGLMTIIKRLLQPRRTDAKQSSLEVEDRIEAAELKSREMTEDLAMVKAKAKTWQRRYH